MAMNSRIFLSSRPVRVQGSLGFYLFIVASPCMFMLGFFSAELVDFQKQSKFGRTMPPTTIEAPTPTVDTAVMKSQLIRSLTAEKMNRLQAVPFSQTEIYKSDLPSMERTEMPKPHLPNTERTSVGEQICYAYSNAACSLASCADQPRATHFRGHLQEVFSTTDNGTSQALPRTRGVCEACRVYSRHCAVSKAYRFIYIHVMKSAGSSVHKFLQSALCEPDSEGGFNCTAPYLEFSECDLALQAHPDFFKWSFVRHPVLRAISAWSMASLAIESGSPVDFNDWAVDPSTLKTQAWAMHWWPQSWFLMDEGHCPIYDYVGTIGPDVRRHMEFVLNKIDSQMLWERYRNGGFPHEFRTDDESRRAAAANLTEPARRALLERYQDDFELFGFDLSDWQGGSYF